MNIRSFLSVLVLLLFPLGLFSQNETTERLKKHVDVFTSDTLMGRMAGTPGEKKASLYIYDEFVKAGVETLYDINGQRFSFLSTFGDTISSQNVIGIIEGSDPKLRDELIIVGAHYDHLGFNKLSVNGKTVTQIFRGANDNASGTAVMIEVARELRRIAFDLKRSVMVIAFGASETSLTGSWYFLDNAAKYKDKIRLMINIDQVGVSQGEYEPMIYTVLPSPELIALLKDVSEKPAMISPVLKSGDTFSSDYNNFVTNGIPAVMFTTALKKQLPTDRDTSGTLDYEGMTDLTFFIASLVQEAANMEIALPATPLKDNQEESGENVKNPTYTIYDVDKRPSFLNGGEKQFLDRWVYDYVKYPKSAVESGLQGRVVVEFIIEKNGEVSSVKVVKSAGDALDAEAVKVVAASPKWKPGMKGGAPVRVKMAIPIEFKLRK
ncbi:MAG: TonB family protein [Bacteroidales bacterium]|nr:TonB family protein [Bacteroidales bacterium]